MRLKTFFCANMFVQYGGSVPNIRLPIILLNLVNKEDIHLDLLRKLEVNPEYTQRELSQEMGVSLGKINYCMKKMIEKGWIKLSNFSHNPNKVGYIYLLTPKGIKQKTRLTFAFLAIKLKEYEVLKNEISKLKQNPKAIIFDLGLSSLQLSDHQRGFSFNSSGFLSMQMGINKYSAYDVVNTLDKQYLTNIIKILGEERDGRIIANKIVKYRAKKPIKTSEELASIINDAKKNYNKYKKNPATKTFQAIRIFVNKELTELISGLIQAGKILSNDGMLIVVSFHSLEDKIVKNFFNLYSNLRKNPSRYLPIKVSKSSLFKQISKKPLVANVKEVNENIRSRSAKLRYAIRNSNSFFDPNEFKKKFVNYFELEGGGI